MNSDNILEHQFISQSHKLISKYALSVLIFFRSMIFLAPHSNNKDLNAGDPAEYHDTDGVVSWTLKPY